MVKLRSLFTITSCYDNAYTRMSDIASHCELTLELLQCWSLASVSTPCPPHVVTPSTHRLLSPYSRLPLPHARIAALQPDSLCVQCCTGWAAAAGLTGAYSEANLKDRSLGKAATTAAKAWALAVPVGHS